MRHSCEKMPGVFMRVVATVITAAASAAAAAAGSGEGLFMLPEDVQAYLQEQAQNPFMQRHPDPIVSEGFFAHYRNHNDLALVQQEEMQRMLDPTPHPISGNSPESILNILDYQIAQPTPLPAVFNGVFCRGGACQYRVIPPITTTFGPTPFPAGVVYGPNKREFCRGLGCIPGMGWPASIELDTFKLNCGHLFDDIGGGMKGNPTRRNMDDVKQSFLSWCTKRTGILEVGMCPAYSEVVVMAMAPSVNEASVGGSAEVCTGMYWFIAASKQAEIDMKLIKEALPPGFGSGKASLLSVSLNHFGTGGVGPNSPRGRRWRAYARKHFRESAPPPAMAEEPMQPPGSGGSLLQTGWESAVWGGAHARCAAPEAPEPTVEDLQKEWMAGDGSEDAEDTRGLPKYNQNPPCTHGVNNIPQTGTKYQLLPGSADGALPPVEVAGELMTYCQDQYNEIMMGYAQTPKLAITMTKDWCRWQGSVTSWAGSGDEYGHPDWNFRTCEAMGNLVSFALRNHLDSEAGFTAHNVCTNLFLAHGPIHRVSQFVKEAWQFPMLRTGPDAGVTTAIDDTEQKKMLQMAQKYADALYGKMRRQKEAFEDLNNAKMDLAAFEASPPAPKLKEAPALPESGDFDPNALSFVVLTRSSLRRWGNGASMAGSAAAGGSAALRR